MSATPVLRKRKASYASPLRDHKRFAYESSSPQQPTRSSRLTFKSPSTEVQSARPSTSSSDNDSVTSSVPSTNEPAQPSTITRTLVMELQRNQASKDEHITKLQTRIDSQNVEISNLQGKLQILVADKHTVRELERHVGSLEGRLQASKDQASDMTADMSRLEQAKQDLMEQNVELVQILRARDDKIKDLKASLGRLETELSYKGELEDTRNDLNDAKHKLREVTLSYKNIADTGLRNRATYQELDDARKDASDTEHKYHMLSGIYKQKPTSRRSNHPHPLSLPNLTASKEKVEIDLTQTVTNMPKSNASLRRSNEKRNDGTQPKNNEQSLGMHVDYKMNYEIKGFDDQSSVVDLPWRVAHIAELTLQTCLDRMSDPVKVLKLEGRQWCLDRYSKRHGAKVATGAEVHTCSQCVQYKKPCMFFEDDTIYVRSLAPENRPAGVTADQYSYWMLSEGA